MSEKLKISILPVDKDNNVQVISFSGDFDKSGYNDVREKLNEEVKSFDDKNLVFDFSALQFINSEGIGYLLEVNNLLLKKDKLLVIVGVNSYVSDIFKTIGIQDIISIHSSLNDFLKKG
jgi:anti-anti-sigma factor